MPNTSAPRPLRREPRHSTSKLRRTGKTRKTNLRAPELVMIPGQQGIIDQLESAGLTPKPIKIGGEIYEAGYTITREQARHWCKVCREEICTCPTKFHAPFMLAWRHRRGQKGVFLRNQELPMKLTRRAA